MQPSYERLAEHLMVVDDDLVIRRHLVDTIRHGMPGDLRITEAIHGLDALAKIEQDPPGLVFVDICMPHMDGIALIRAVRARWPWMQLIVLSNYDEFAYVKGAFKEGVLDYVLKYEVEQSRLCELIAGGRHALSVALGQAQSRARELRAEKIDRMRARGMELKLRIADPSRASAREAPVGVVMSSAVGEPDASEGWQAAFEEAIAATADGADAFLLPGEPGSAVETGGMLLTAGWTAARERAEAICASLAWSPVRVCSAYAAPLPGGAPWAHLSAAAGAARQVFYVTGCSVVDASDWREPDTAPERPEYIVYPAECAQLVSQFCLDDALKRLQATVDALRTDRPAPAEARRTLYRYCTLLSDERGGLSPLPFNALDNLNFAADALALKIRQAAPDGAPALYNPSIARAVAYLLKRLDDPPSLDQIARVAGYSRNHFCSLFRQSMDDSYNNYINRMRIRRSCLLMRGGGLSAADAARTVGFDDVRYFQRVFERHVGMTAAQWREHGERLPI